MKTTNLILIVSALVLGACAKAPPPQTNVISIPIQLVNYTHVESNTPDEPSTRALVKINAADPADESLETVTEYTKELHGYAKEVTGMLVISEAENKVLRGKLDSIRNYIIISQPRIQPVQ